jgi:hypothetical protein
MKTNKVRHQQLIHIMTVVINFYRKKPRTSTRAPTSRTRIVINRHCSSLYQSGRRARDENNTKTSDFSSDFYRCTVAMMMDNCCPFTWISESQRSFPSTANETRRPVSACWNIGIRSGCFCSLSFRLQIENAALGDSFTGSAYI